MDAMELVDRLCAVTTEQADIIRQQAYLIENCLGVDEETKKNFAAMREPVEEELDRLEYCLRPLNNSGK